MIANFAPRTVCRAICMRRRRRREDFSPSGPVSAVSARSEPRSVGDGLFFFGRDAADRPTQVSREAESYQAAAVELRQTNMGGSLTRPWRPQLASGGAPQPRPLPLSPAFNSTGGDHIREALIAEASREWRLTEARVGDRTRPAIARPAHAVKIGNGSCTTVLEMHGLCDESLFRAPTAPRRRYTNEQPFMFLHLSKCAGTSMISALSYMGYAAFTVRLPQSLATVSECASGVSAKCCWWRERLANMSAHGGAPKVLEQEPANDVKWIESRGIVSAVDPGFDARHDFCPDLAYATILRLPIERIHSHMCELGVPMHYWQSKAPQKRFHAVKTVLRDNYYVRALGGAAAWNAKEGGVSRRHLLSAARTLARFDVVMTVSSLERDAPVQMARVGLAGFRWKHAFSRSRADNLQRATEDPSLRTFGWPSCEIPPTPRQLDELVAASYYDRILYEFALVLAAHRTEAYASGDQRRATSTGELDESRGL